MTAGVPPSVGVVTPDPAYRLALGQYEAWRCDLDPPLLCRTQEHAQAAVELMLLRFARGLRDEVVPLRLTPAFVAGFIRAVQRRELADYAFDVLVDLSALRRTALRPRTKEQDLRAHGLTRVERIRRQRPRHRASRTSKHRLPQT